MRFVERKRLLASLESQVMLLKRTKRRRRIAAAKVLSTLNAPDSGDIPGSTSAEDKNFLKAILYATSVEKMESVTRVTPVFPKSNYVEDICSATISLIRFTDN